MKSYENLESEDVFEMAIGWIGGRDFEKAIECLERSIALNPNFVYAYVTLASVHARTGSYSRAIEVLLKALRVDPDFERLNWLIAKYAYRRGDYPLALKHINAAIQRNSSPLYLRGREIIRNARGGGQQ